MKIWILLRSLFAWIHPFIIGTDDLAGLVTWIHDPKAALTERVNGKSLSWNLIGVRKVDVIIRWMAGGWAGGPDKPVFIRFHPRRAHKVWPTTVGEARKTLPGTERGPQTSKAGSPESATGGENARCSRRGGPGGEDSRGFSRAIALTFWRLSGRASGTAEAVPFHQKIGEKASFWRPRSWRAGHRRRERSTRRG